MKLTPTRRRGRAFVITKKTKYRKNISDEKRGRKKRGNRFTLGGAAIPRKLNIRGEGRAKKKS